MVNKISPVSCIVDFKGSNKQFKRYIVDQVETIKNHKSFEKILEEAKNKLNGGK